MDPAVRLNEQRFKQTIFYKHVVQRASRSIVMMLKFRVRVRYSSLFANRVNCNFKSPPMQTSRYGYWIKCIDNGYWLVLFVYQALFQHRY